MAGSACSEVLPEALRTLTVNCPDAVQLGDVTTISGEDIQRLVTRFPNCTLVLLVAGSPCTDVSGLNASGKGLAGSQSGLYIEIPRIKKLIDATFGQFAVIHMLVECVASMSAVSEAQMSAAFGVQPVAICSRGIAWCSRPRLFWIDWPLLLGPGVKFEKRDRHEACILSAEKAPWPFSSTPANGNATLFPCLVRAIRRKKPPFKPAGIHTCSQQDLKMWESDQFRYPPYHYRPEHLVREGSARTPNAQEREFIMGFKPNTTINAFAKGDRKARPQPFEDARCSLCGNSIVVGVLAWLFAQLLYARGMVDSVVSPQQVVDSISLDWQERGGNSTSASGIPLVQQCVRSAAPKGSDVRIMTGELMNTSLWPRRQIPPTMWKWRVVIAYKWKFEGEHINSLELRAYLAALKWRARKAGNLGTRFLHLLDSQVCIGLGTKGRTSAKALMGTLEQCNALCLAAGFYPFLGYVVTDENPADAPSRWFPRPPPFRGRDGA